MSSSKVYTCVRVSLPESLNASSRVGVLGRITRWCCSHAGSVLSSPDNSFLIADVDGMAIAQLSRIVEVVGGVTYIRLLSSAFFDKLFAGEVVG